MIGKKYSVQGIIARGGGGGGGVVDDWYKE